jgi:hypothetical protein
VNFFEFTLLIWLGSLVAGLLGSLTGLGGGVILVPLLTLVFGVDIRYAIGASLASVIATSSGAAEAYVKEGFSNIRIRHPLKDRRDPGCPGCSLGRCVLPGWSRERLPSLSGFPRRAREIVSMGW